MRRIEFIGTEGIGKTSLFNDLIHQRKKSENWLTLDEARKKVALKYAIENWRISHNYLLATLLLSFPFQNTITKTISDLVLKNPDQELVEEKILYHPFFSFLIDFSGTNFYNPQIRLHRILNLYKNSCRIINLENFQSPDIFLIEEGTILGYGLYMSHWQDYDYQKKAISFFHKIPPPAGIIHCILDNEEAITRIYNRSKNGIITIAHRDSDNYHALVDLTVLRKIIQMQNSITEIGIEILKRKNVKILTIDLKKSTMENILRIKKFLDEFDNKNNK